jgi:hypothetical protein
LSIDVFIADAGRIAGASLGTSTAVNTNLEAKVVNLLCSAVDAIGELCQVGKQPLSTGIAVVLDRPAVVDVDIFISDILASVKGEEVKLLGDEIP